MSAPPYQHRYMTQGVQRSRQLRTNATPTEKKFWSLLRQSAKTHNLHFRRQCPIHPYIADFACLKIKLVIELDGETHANQIQYDLKRDADMHRQGYTIMRFSNQQIAENTEGIVMMVLAKAVQLQQTSVMAEPPPP